ncbi:MAG: hypothetical protein C0497_03070 [Gemmatimonas sp.]|nr:hypothetical protein [Gemmatimonas sp.]
MPSRGLHSQLAGLETARFERGDQFRQPSRQSGRRRPVVEFDRGADARPSKRDPHAIHAAIRRVEVQHHVRHRQRAACILESDDLCDPCRGIDAKRSASGRRR